MEYAITWLFVLFKGHLEIDYEAETLHILARKNTENKDHKYVHSAPFWYKKTYTVFRS